ncbi:MAG: hypothetical protein QT02_C0006G0027 [archaeon GW2011_AR9]|nr:MAG: hypothetical protein QT02_C0006G0027 [archaeon GW2011_AR9]MBS3120455.1 hypothetical protein [Candidatus Woesearchaeota archaeon]HIG93755.1 hypothetical protein [Candidatus Woesearchaeota archaeon]HIH12612.1 hypothetical protein [Candidatus Woesearchaeota archaeon]
MPERTLIIDHLKFSYEGVFNLAELYGMIANFFYEKGWDWYERINQEMVTPTGKQIKIVLEPWKNVSDFYKLTVSIKMLMTDVRDVEVEHEGQTLKVNHGVIHITFDGYVIADRKGRWESTPFYWFLSVVSQKYFYRDHFTKMETWLKSDLDDLHTKIKSYLNVFNYNYHL